MRVAPVACAQAATLTRPRRDAQLVNLSAVTVDGARPAHLTLAFAQLQPQAGVPLDWSCMRDYDASLYTMGGRELFIAASVGFGGATLFGAGLGLYMYWSCRARQRLAKPAKKTH